MEEEELRLLRQISEGIRIFEPLKRTSQELTRFQETVRLLLQMEKDGLVHQCFTDEHEISGTPYFDMIHIPSGLTEKGEERLREAGG